MPKNKAKFGHNKLILIGALLAGAVLLGVATYLLTRTYYEKRYEGVCYTFESEKICSGSIVGLDEESAIKLVKDKGFNPVVVQRDGKNIFRSLIGDPLRVSLWVSNDRVTKVDFYK